MKGIVQVLAAFREQIILLLALSSAIVLINSNENQQMRFLRMKMIDALGSIQKSFNSFSEFVNLKEENKILRERCAQLAFANSLMREALLENRRLRKMLGFKRRTPYHLIPAEVIAQRYKGVSYSIVLNVGREEGVKKDSPIVTDRGLIGKLIQVGGGSSIGQLLMDRNFRVSARVQRSGVLGIVHPKVGRFLRLDNVPRKSDVKVGDVVVTSGYSEIFPPGIKIGVVVDVSEEKQGLFKKVVLRTDVDFPRLREVFVITTP